MQVCRYARVREWRTFFGLLPLERHGRRVSDRGERGGDEPVAVVDRCLVLERVLVVGLG